MERIPIDQIAFNPDLPVPSEEELAHIPPPSQWLLDTYNNLGLPPPSTADIEGAIELAQVLGSLTKWNAAEKLLMQAYGYTVGQYWIWCKAESREGEFAKDLIGLGKCWAQYARGPREAEALHNIRALLKKKYDPSLPEAAQLLASLGALRASK